MCKSWTDYILYKMTKHSFVFEAYLLPSSSHNLKRGKKVFNILQCNSPNLRWFSVAIMVNTSPNRHGSNNVIFLQINNTIVWTKTKPCTRILIFQHSLLFIPKNQPHIYITYTSDVHVYNNHKRRNFMKLRELSCWVNFNCKWSKLSSAFNL